MARKGIAFAAVIVMVLLVAAQPASAGVGGCRPAPGVGGCAPGGWHATAQDTGTRNPSVLDYSRGAIPVQMYAFLQALLAQRTATPDDGGLVAAPEDLTTSGVGGCFRPGVGGCICSGGFC